MNSGMGHWLAAGVVAWLACWQGNGASAQPASEPRPLAPGVLKVFSPVLDARDTFTVPMPVPGLTTQAYEPNFAPKAFTAYGQTHDVVFFRDIWHIEFATVGLRQIELAYRLPDGEIQIRHYWYLPYRLRDVGRSITYREVADESAVARVQKQIQFDDPEATSAKPPAYYPDLQLVGWVFDEQGERQVVRYRDQYLPDVAKEIQKVEDPHRRLYDKLEMPQQTIPLAESESDLGLWGVAIWEQVDPNIDFCSVQVRGLTNAYRLAQTLDGEVHLRRKVLQLNFYRPGDSVRQTRDKVSFGVPLVLEHGEQIEICKRYFLPGPQIHAVWYDGNHGNEILMAEIDAEVSLTDFTSPVTAQLDGGELPENLSMALDSVGLAVAPGAPVRTIVQGGMWQIAADRDGTSLTIDLKLRPQYWEKKDRGIRFIRTIDYLWVYQ